MSNDESKDAKRRSLRQHGTLNPRPERVHSELFASGEFFDPEDAMQVKYEMLRAAQEESRSVSEVTRQFGLSRPVFYHAKRGYAEAGMAGLLPQKRGPKGPHKLTPQVVSVIAELLSADEGVGPEQVRDRLQAELGTRLHVRTVQRAMQALRKRGRRQ